MQLSQRGGKSDKEGTRTVITSLTNVFTVYFSIGSRKVLQVIYSWDFIADPFKYVPSMFHHLVKRPLIEFLKQPAEGDMITVLQLEQSIQLFLWWTDYWHRSITISINCL